jgi:hypothetical protein
MSLSNESDTLEQLLSFLWGDGTFIDITESVFALKVLVTDRLNTRSLSHNFCCPCPNTFLIGHDLIIMHGGWI